MRNLKKIFAVFMSVLMIGMTALTAAFTASAKDFTDVKPDSAYTEQIDMLSDIGVIKGTSENEFSPDEKVTREQMALLLYRLMTAKDNSGRVNTSPFTDLYEPTYNGAISWAHANGFILGTSETTFAPTGGITLQDAIAMVTRALGQTNDRTNAGYPWSFIDIGTRIGLTNGLENVSYTDTLTRAETAALLYNALTADYIIVKTVSGTPVATTTTVLRYVYGYEAGTAFITATNNYALPGTSAVVKNGYAEVQIADGEGNVKTAFVNASDLELDGNIDSHLGESVRVFYNINDRTGIVSILGTTNAGMSKTVNSFTYDTGRTHVRIDGVKYKVVDRYSSSVSTNANELVVFAYNGTGVLTQVTTNADLASLDGFFNLKLIYDDQSGTASRAILMPLTYAKLEITSAGSINIAGGLTEKDLTGGFVNNADAKSGDLVLFYFDSTMKRLVIAEKLETIRGAVVSRLTATTATIGGKLYTLGITGTSFDASSVYASLTVGEKFDIVTFGDKIVSAEVSTTETTFSSTYLIAMSTATPVVYKDQVCYFMKANIGGANTNVYVKNNIAVSGEIYRYETDKDGILTLIPDSDPNFIGRGEIKTVVDSANSMTIDKGGRVNYTLTQGMTSVDFVTDANTVIAVGTPNGIVYKAGAYASTITVNDGAKVVAVMKDNTGTVETLKYLYISSGSLGSALDTNSYVKILANVALEYVDGSVMNAYKVLNFANGKIETFYSSNGALEVGRTYILDENKRITSNEKVLETGTVTGYTGNIVTIDATTYRLSENAVVCAVQTNAAGEFVVRNLALSEIYGKNVSFIANGNEITRIILN